MTELDTAKLLSAWRIEIWVPVPGREGYEVSNLGGIRLDGQPVVPKTWDSYPMVRLGTRQQYVAVHRIELEAFVGPCPEGMEGCHDNDVKHDNRLYNLRWDTQRRNAQDAVRNGRHGKANRTHCKHGHEYTAANTMIVTRPDGSTYRQCRTCHRQRQTDRGEPG
jgi:hypothetical protein